MGVEVFSINFLKEMNWTWSIGDQPARDLVTGTLYEGAALFQCCVPRCGAGDKGTCMGSGHRHESAHQRHTQNCT